ncbi:MAG: hypothetical protein KatS3mg019_1234 [Fimbriimonadales bacterium]|nr:MAG: hypothetical protein KatS3mg019_1234 [Fimbriimonadales bacterium]
MLLIAESQMMLLLNQLGDAAVVRAPLLNGTPLFQLNLSGRQASVEQIITSSEYARVLDDVREQMQTAAMRQNPPNPDSLAEELKRELPDYNRLRDAFRQAGVVKPSNLEEIEDLQKQIQRSNPARGGDIYYLAFDNNALRNRLYSLYFKPKHRNAQRYNLLLAQFVRQELEPRMGKIQYDFLQAFNAAYSQLNIVSIFQNQSRLNDRLRMLGISEWNRVLESGDAEVQDAPNQRDSDGQIIEAYARFAAHAGRKVLVFSSDNEFIVRCSGRTNLNGQLVAYPPALETSYAVEWEPVGRLLYQTAILYGRIDVETDDMQALVYGVWDRKSAPHWDAEQVKLTITPSQSLQEQAIARNLEILSQLNRNAP